MIKINKYLLGFHLILIFFCIVIYTVNALTTGAYKIRFMEAYNRADPNAKLEYMQVVKISSYSGKAKVFFIETKKDDDGKSYQIGKTVDFIYEPIFENWHYRRSKIYWDDRRDRGNKFTFPPYIGRDKLILLKR